MKEYARPSPIKAHRWKCLDCCGGSSKMVRYCQVTSCPSWYLRMGVFPDTYIKNNPHLNPGEFFEKKNFKIGGKFGPEKELSELD
jgi:hypothetical protein